MDTKHNCRIPDVADVRYRTPEFASLTKVSTQKEIEKKLFETGWAACTSLMVKTRNEKTDVWVKKDTRNDKLNENEWNCKEENVEKKRLKSDLTPSVGNSKENRSNTPS